MIQLLYEWFYVPSDLIQVFSGNCSECPAWNEKHPLLTIENSLNNYFEENVAEEDLIETYLSTASSTTDVLFWFDHIPPKGEGYQNLSLISIGSVLNKTKMVFIL